ncbi:isochorismatase family protein [Tunicatimonas pelagia]|uniref:isochorismatase family protein n=1 Tax=Tunicatimonas pelagia TaxID=931531 RepID=UPI002666D1E9|nr:isochorismatase family protein [Tunicatimonas pelagia]WKN42402.1 isochorismatase family protein [Tunicatimonas pelagia]
MGRKAFIVIDMQGVSFTALTPRFDTEGVVKRINLLSSYFRKQDAPVIFIQHDGTKEGGCIPGTEEWKLLPELEVEPTDLVISKMANDAFYRSDLPNQLSRMDVKELVITGCATDFCVEATVQSALVKDYSVTVVRDGHTTADRPSLKAIDVIDHYNWVWENMTPTNGAIQVLTTEQILHT